ncbi:hypothetical protein A2U01_0077083 [Trifolium medium]|uniref:Uncharacterized protein n=1 Tax=Trifolium medium TaxID=97028 RepID=A0A392T4Y9_9FABA|nr:hypothetical protein [Trifolium medium]
MLPGRSVNECDWDSIKMRWQYRILEDLCSNFKACRGMNEAGFTGLTVSGDNNTNNGRTTSLDGLR